MRATSRRLKTFSLNSLERPSARIVALTIVAEASKLRRVWLVWIVGVGGPVLVYIIVQLEALARPSVVAWHDQLTTAANIWTMFLLPISTMITADTLARVESEENGWNYLFTLPVPRSLLYWAKVVIAALLIAGATFAMAAIFVGGGYVAHALLGAETPDVSRAFLLSARICVASSFMVSAAVFLSIRLRPPAALAIQVGLWIVGLGLGLSAAPLYPWSLPIIAGDPNTLGITVLWAVAAAALSAVAAVHHSHHEPP